jgi:ABC-type nitrate/sulfonate/bicarbonate transport system substrate-binding protein
LSDKRKLAAGTTEKGGHPMRRMIVTIFALLFLCTMTADARAQERLNLAYISPTAGSSSVFWVAKDMGIFKKHGLDVNVIYIEGTPKALMSLFAGDLQVVAGTGPAVVSAKLRGGDVTMIMGFEIFLPYYLMATPGINRIEDLKGKIGANHTAATSADFAIRLAWSRLRPGSRRHPTGHRRHQSAHYCYAAGAGSVHGHRQLRARARGKVGL